MEKLDFNSELLQPMRLSLELILNRLMNVVVTGQREAEINLKINLNSIKRGKTNKYGKYIEWEEPDISYHLTDRIKELKGEIKKDLDTDYEIQIDEETGNVYIQKINEQTSMFEEDDE